MTRRRIFISHAFRHVDDYAALLDRLRAYNCEIYNHSIPFWKPADAEGQELADIIDRKIQGCDVVLVLVTPGIHKSDWITYEMQKAKHYGKRVIGVWRHGEKQRVPIPALLDEQIYHMVGWNGPAIIRAMEGDYPADARVFDIAEDADRRRLQRMLVSGVSIAMLVLIGARDAWVGWLNRALALRGISIQLEPIPDGTGVGGPALFGTLVGATLSAFTARPEENVVAMALAGGAIGAAIGAVCSYRLRVLRADRVNVINVTFEDS